MISINPVFQVLVTKGNQAIAAAGLRPDQILDGQLGVFDRDTNLTIDGTKSAQNQNVYFAVGINRSGGTAAEDIMKSAGNSVKKYGMRAITMKPYAAPVNQVLTYKFGKIVPNEDYVVKFEIQNAEAFANFGYNLPSKVFVINGGDEVFTDTGLASTKAFVADLVANINADDEDFLTAAAVPTVAVAPTLVAATTGGALAAGAHTYRIVGVDEFGTTLPGPSASVTTTGTTSTVTGTFAALPGADSYRIYRGTTATDHNSYITSSTNSFTDTGAAGTAGVVPTANTSEIADSMTVTVNPMTYKAFTSVNLKYSKIRQTVVTPSLMGFGRDSSVTQTTDPVYSDQLGYDLQELEYEAAGWNGGGIYRASDTTYLKNTEYFSVGATGYDTFSLTYDNSGIGGGEKHDSSLLTMIAVPSADNTTATAVKNLINRMYNGAELADTTALNAFPEENMETIQ